MRISRFARRDVLIVTAKNLCEIALSAMEALEVAWKHVLVDQDRQQLIDVQIVFILSFEVSYVDGIFIENVLYEPEVVQISRNLPQKLMIEPIVERKALALLQHLVDRIRAVDDGDNGNDEFEELGSISVREHVVAKSVKKPNVSLAA